MLDRARSVVRDLRLGWTDLVWLVFLGGLALLPPIDEIHKQLIILAIVVFQLFEGWLISRLPERGPAYSVIIKILLATLLLDHTGEVGINSSYYPIFFLPVVSAATYFGPLSPLSVGPRPHRSPTCRYCRIRRCWTISWIQTAKRCLRSACFSFLSRRSWSTALRWKIVVR